MDIRKVKKLIELIEESDIEEIEIKEGDDCVRISRRTRQTTVSYAPVPTYESVAQPTSAPMGASQPAGDAATETGNGEKIRSPMVGTFYRPPTPSAPVFVEWGQRVKVDDVLSLVETMMIINLIGSDRAGGIEAILVQNRQPVEFDEP